MNYEAIKQLQIKVSRSSKIPKPIWNPLHAQFSFKKRCIQGLFFSLLDLGTSTDVYYATQAVWRHLLFASKQVPSCFTCLFATLFCCKAPEKVLWTTKPHLNFQTEFFFIFGWTYPFSKLFQNMWRGSYPYCKNTVTIQCIKSTNQ